VEKARSEGRHLYDRNGIYYSATAVESKYCVGKSIAVVGAGNSGGQAAMFLSECAPKVYLLVHSDSMEKGMSAYLFERIKANKRIEVIFNSEVTETHGIRTEAGEPKLTGITLTDLVSKQTRKLEVTALFAFIGAEPLTDYVPAEARRTEHGHLITGHLATESQAWPLTDREPCELETSIPRLLAAGDIRAGSTKRVGFAVGDGALAVTCAHRLLQK
jgi:thioredoxin reductase (NADPH)